MNLLESMNQVMQYIEEHLIEKIDPELLAKNIGCSQWYLQRIFSEWFPNSGYEHAQVPEIEAYYDGDKMAADYKSEVWIPVVKKA